MQSQCVGFDPNITIILKYHGKWTLLYLIFDKFDEGKMGFFGLLGCDLRQLLSSTDFF